jgi:hypothetical protein
METLKVMYGVKDVGLQGRWCHKVVVSRDVTEITSQMDQVIP